MAEETQVSEPTNVEPTDEQVMQGLTGEQQGADTEPQAAEVQKPTTQAGPDINAVMAELAALKKELGPMRSELGGLRKLRSEFDQSKNAAPKTPQSYAELTPEQQAATRELIKYAWEQEHGSTFNEIKQFMESQKQFGQLQGTFSKAQQYAGNDWKELDPIMGKLLADYDTKGDAGDDEAAQIAREIRQGSPAALKYIINEARQELSKTVQGQAAVNQQKQAETKKRVTTALGTTPSAQTGDVMANLPKDPAKRAAALRKILVDAGELEA